MTTVHHMEELVMLTQTENVFRECSVIPDPVVDLNGCVRV